MKKIYYNLKPFLIFQAIIVSICILLEMVSTESDIWILAGFLVPYYSGGIYIIGALFGAWIQFRSESKLKVIICNNIFAFILILISIAIQFYQMYSFDTFLMALYQFLCFIGGQIIILALEFFVFIYDLIKKNHKEKK